MPAIGPVITAQELDLAGIAGDLRTALLGMRWDDAKTLLTGIVGLVAAKEGIDRGAVSSYSLNGRTVSASLAQLEQALKVIRAALGMMSSRGGILTMAVEFQR